MYTFLGFLSYSKSFNRYLSIFNRFLSIRIKSDCFNSALPNAINVDSNCLNDSEAIGNAFNLFFTSISSNSLSKDDESKDFVFKQFADLKNNKIIRTGDFSFKQISAATVA